MNPINFVLLGMLASIPIISYFSFNNLTLNNYKKHIERFGHKLEENEIKTEDGYIINLWHLIPNFIVNKEKVIYLHPGFASTGLCYFGLKEKSLAYYLQEKGYDVWIGNNRGSKFSSKHVSKDSKKVNGDYWEFCMDHFVRYDIVSEIEFIKKRTDAEKVDFVGYSEGSTLFLMLYMDNPNFVESSINKFVSIGTIPNLSNTTLSIADTINNIYKFLKISEPFSKAFKLNDQLRTVLVKSIKANPSFYEKQFQKEKIITNRSNATAIANFFTHYPTDLSVYHLYQWEEIQEEEKLVYFNFHPKKNDKVKEYDLNIIKNWKIKALITRSKFDGFSSYEEVTKLCNTIQNKSLITIFESEYAHLDYGMAESAYKDFYIPLVDYLDKK